MDNETNNTGPLKGIRVLDVSSVVAGPVACQLLGDFGADIIKIEHPKGGDSMRYHGPSKEGIPLWWKIVGRNKRSVGLYLGDPDAAEVFRQLVRTADVVLENFRPGTLERWGLGYDTLKEINPNLLLIRITGFGQEGPYARKPAFGTLAESMSTFAHITGPEDGPPTLPPFGLADNIAGLAAASATLMGLVNRYRNDGEGQVVDLSILEPIMMTLGFQVIWYDQLGIVERRRGNRSVNNAPRNTYQAGDGQWIAVSASTNPTAERLIELVGRPEISEEPWFNTGQGRVANAALLDEVVSAWISTRSQTEILEACEKAEVPASPVYDIEQLVNDPHVRATEMVTTVDDVDLGPTLMPNVVFRMSETPGRIRFTGRSLGEDTKDILIGELGMDPAAIEALRERGVLA